MGNSIEYIKGYFYIKTIDNKLNYILFFIMYTIVDL